MRETLFRGKVKYNELHLFENDFIVGSLIIKSKGYFIYVIEKDEFDNIIREFEIEVKPETVGQFTGFYDKNKIKIFENDIIYWISTNPFSFGEKRYCSIMFSDGGLWWCLGTNDTKIYVGLGDLLSREKVEVVSNTIDNTNRTSL